jgi:transcription initiation protein SPT3
VIKKEDTLEILGFLAAEMVKRLTDIALTIQAQDSTAHQRQNGQSVEALGQRRDGMFVPLKTERPPIDVVHIQRAFDETQMKPKRRRVKLNRIAGPKTLELI